MNIKCHTFVEKMKSFIASRIIQVINTYTVKYNCVRHKKIGSLLALAEMFSTEKKQGAGSGLGWYWDKKYVSKI